MTAGGNPPSGSRPPGMPPRPGGSSATAQPPAERPAPRPAPVAPSPTSAPVAESKEVDPRVARLLPVDFCRKNRVVLLHESPAGAVLGMVNPQDQALVTTVEQRIARRVKPIAMRPWDIEQALNQVFATKVDASSADLRVEVRPLRRDTRISAVDLASGILGDALFYGCTDIHLERFPDGVEIRYRVDGIMHGVSTPVTPPVYAEVISRLKVVAELDVAEHRTAQDGRFTILAVQGNEQRMVDVRVTILPGPDGEEAVLRMLDPGRVVLDLTSIGMEAEDVKLINHLIRNPEGMIIVAGPTGSGKTTTLYSCLGDIADGTRKVVTAEDPIEYRLPKINQKQAGPKASLAELARAFLRADPDVILIGEIRDEETAMLAARAAQTGHLVFTTLHLDQAINAPNRLHTLGLAYETIGPALLCVIAQRLVRRVCPDCRVKYTPSQELVEMVPGSEKIQELWRGRGCSRCKETGYRGRTGLYEVMYCNEEVGALIQAGAPRVELRAALKRRGHRSLRQDALRKLSRGVTTLEEIYRVVPKRVLDDN
jgi:general secretion pathway protein E